MRAIIHIVKILRQGGVIAFPTETVYGLGVDIFNEKAVNKLYQLKGRDFNKPLSIFVSSLEMLENYVAEIPPVARELIQKYWAGPLTLVFKASSKVPRSILAGGTTIGIRMSPHKVINQIVERLGRPITATSANLSGSKAATTAEDVRDYFPCGIHEIIEVPSEVGKVAGGIAESVASTVVDISQHDIRILREGTISQALAV